MHRLISETPPASFVELPGRLAPEIASFRRLLLRYIRDYIVNTGGSPSYGEMAAKLGTNRDRVKRAVLALEREGLLIRKPGHRGLALPEMRDAAINYLRGLGYCIDEDVHTLGRIDLPLTKLPLLTTPALDYPARRGGPSGTAGGADDGITSGEGEGARSRRGAERAA